MTKVRQITNSTHQVIDYKIGIAGAIFLGGVVFGINYFATHEITGSVTAALKQGSYISVRWNFYERLRKSGNKN